MKAEIENQPKTSLALFISRKGEMKVVETTVLIIMAIIVIGIYYMIGVASNLPSTLANITDKAPDSSLILADPENTFVQISWDGPHKTGESRSVVEYLLGRKESQGYYYFVEVNNLKLLYDGDKLPTYPIHAILSIKGEEVKDLPGKSLSFQLTAKNTEDGVFYYPDIKTEKKGIWSVREPLRTETDSVIDVKDKDGNTVEKSLVYNDEFIIIGFWKETDCFKQNYKDNPQAPELMRLCCPSKEKCDWLGSVNLESSEKMYSSSLINGEIEFTEQKEFGTGDEEELFFTIRNTGDISWDKDGIDIDDNLVFVLAGCLGSKLDANGIRLPVIKRYRLFDSISRTIVPGGVVESTEIGSITCKLPQQKQGVELILIGNCLTKGDIAPNSPCANEHSIVLSVVKPFLT